MKSKFYFRIGLVITSVFVLGCKDDDSPAPIITPEPVLYSVNTVTIDDSNYTHDSPVSLSYSLDKGATFVDAKPTGIEEGDTIWVNIKNTSEDFSLTNFNIDWSESSIIPSKMEGSTAEFILEDDLNIHLKVSDVLTLIATNAKNGKFYSINETNGNKEELFAFKADGDTLKNIRGLVYHYNLKKYFASENTNAGGKLYEIDPLTKEATVINNNDGNEGAYQMWDALVGLAVAPDDSLIVIGDFNGDGNGIVKFGTDGGRSLQTTKINICCGLGLLYDVKKPESILIANSNNSNDGEVIFEEYSLSGELSYRITSLKHNNFPEDLSLSWLNMKEMSVDYEGNVYGVLLSYETKASYFVQIDIDTYDINYISTLGENETSPYQALIYLPKYLL